MILYIKINIRILFYSVEFTTETAMSEELIAFKKRISSLAHVLSQLTTIEKSSNTRLLFQKAKVLETIVRNSETLNTGGHFEWVDSKIVRALKFGQYICLEHVNLCSSAILDRLNSVFEPNGKLLMSEKGVTDDNQSENVGKHQEFRAFLTLDPKNGEISRAMRNRCIELNLEKDTYTQGDLKELIYENGITEMHLIDSIYRIHQRVQQLSEFNTFTVSHVCKFAFLVNENLRLGSEEKKSLYDSALETYVRSSHVDLLGFGLQYYQNKLRDEITDELNQEIDKCVDVVSFHNVIVRANQLNSLSMIRLQSEPLLTAISCSLANMQNEQIKKVFVSLRNGFADIDLNVEWTSIKYILYILYELSSTADLDLRQKYIEAMLDKLMTNQSIDDHVRRERKLNAELAKIIKSYKENTYECVPWNRHMFPRIRDYAETDSNIVDQLKLSLMLLAQISCEEIEVDTKFKQSHINVITYSKAVNAKTIPNGLDKDLITYLHPFLDCIRSIAMQMIQKTDSLTYEQYSRLMLAFLWSNRLYKVSQNKLFTEKSLDKTIIDKITLHFNWLIKHLINTLNELNANSASETKESVQFKKSLQKLQKFVTDNHHPLSEMRKQFVKRLTNFTPFYEENQVLLHEHNVNYVKQTQLKSSNWQRGNSDENSRMLINKLRIIMDEECAKYKNYLLKQTNADELTWLNELNADDILQIKNEEVFTLFNQIVENRLDTEPDSIVPEDLNEQQQHFIDFCKKINDMEGTSDAKSFRLITSLLPIMEYFALKALNSVHRQQSHLHTMNLKFFQTIKSIDVNTLNLIRTVSTAHFKICESIWNAVGASIENGNQDNIETTINALPAGFYKKYSSFLRNLNTRIRQFYQNSFALNNAALMNSADDENASKLSELSINGPVLTTATFSSLFDEFGNLKATGLGDLDVWRETLTSLSKLIWNNIEMIQSTFNFEKSNLQYSITNGQKLLSEIHYIQSCVTESTENQRFLGEFQQVIKYLQENIDNQRNSTSSDSTPQNRLQQFYSSSLINALIGVLELHLLTFMPLVDPVERNRLKKVYIEEDQMHLARIISAYDFMKVIMSYEDLGEQIVTLLHSKEKSLKDLLQKYSKKCALRPEICAYAELVDQTNFFLENGCRPKSQLELMVEIGAAFNQLYDENSLSQQDLQKANEVIRRIDWCINTAESFEQSTISRYSTYYRDFTAPLESSVSMLKYGFNGLKHCLVKARDSIVMKSNGNFYQINQAEALSHTINNLVEFPSLHGLKILPSEMESTAKIGILTILEKLDNKEASYFM